MDKYLLEILKSVNTIIIPGLGALTITNHDTGEIMFMSYLKHDDGKLAQYIVDHEGFEELDAKNLIAKYVREIQLTLDKGESYDMYQFGSFYKDGDDIDFKNWEKSSVKSETEEVEPTVIGEKIEVQEKLEDEVIEEIVPPIIAEKVTEPIIEKQEPIVVHLTEEKAEKELNILEKEERAATAAKLEKLKSEKDKTSDRKKKGVGFWMLITLIVLILAGGSYFGLNYDRLKQHIPFLADTSITDSTEKKDKTLVKELEDEVEPTIESEPELEEPVNEVEEPEKVIETPPATYGNDLPFHIIAGAFGSEANATRLGEKLKSEGYTVKVGPGRGMTLVSIKSFATKAEAQTGINKLLSVAPNAWIYEWK
ncbi:MAG: SPOR domain-containing protein [Crocinitomicaceae bacterium]